MISDKRFESEAPVRFLKEIVAEGQRTLKSRKEDLKNFEEGTQEWVSRNTHILLVEEGYLKDVTKLEAEIKYLNSLEVKGESQEEDAAGKK